MDKQQTLDEIKRTAEENRGMPLGRDRFQAATGIAQRDWYGKLWRTWGEALAEAGFPANELQKAYDEQHVVSKLVELIRELGRYPVWADLRMKARSDPQFPSHNVFERIGTKAQRARKAIEYCRGPGRSRRPDTDLPAHRRQSDRADGGIIELRRLGDLFTC